MAEDISTTISHIKNFDTKVVKLCQFYHGYLPVSLFTVLNYKLSWGIY